jgi:hypothetical protein
MKKPKPVFHLRLLNGDEILCQVIRKDKAFITVQDALVVDEVKDNETGRSSIFLSKYTLTGDDKVKLRVDHVVTMTNVAPEIEDYYKNSVEYSKNYIEPTKLTEIAKVSSMLGSINKQPEIIVLKTSNVGSYPYSPSSNSVN